MANPTTNFGWVMPTSASLVTNLPADFNVFGQGVDTSMQYLLGGTTGQILSKTSATNMAFTWIANDTGDITGVTAGTGISGGGTSGTVTVTNSMATEITAAGDIIVGTGSGTFDNLPIGTTAQVLTADTTVSPYKVKWATPATAASGLTKISAASFSGVATTTTTFDGVFTATYNNYYIVFENMRSSVDNADFQFAFRLSGSTLTTGYYGKSSAIGQTILSTTNGTRFSIGYLRSAAGSENAYTTQVYRNTYAMSFDFMGVTRFGDSPVFGGGFKDGLAASGADGFILQCDTGNITGKATIYGLAI